MAYLQYFLQIRNGVRSWVQIINNCYRLWELSKQPKSKTRVGELSGELGIKDSINRQIFTLKYDIRAKKEDATAANIAFTERIHLLDQTDDERLFNPFFRIPGELVANQTIWVAPGQALFLT
ncbi:hypothetical protein PGT21_003045 [Puccinia graminis f. sp. tritici]|uniref:Uncharacterized protein n=1 Tax=Puccinia graminis f. sp. tritici TaxID=56615 RepID=A0A5B0NK14_PUCGR|nr:hypothetical protein PGT21_003045 [Puccinia graminis f. sp. tritici]